MLPGDTDRAMHLNGFARSIFIGFGGGDTRRSGAQGKVRQVRGEA